MREKEIHSVVSLRLSVDPCGNSFLSFHEWAWRVNTRSSSSNTCKTRQCECWDLNEELEWGYWQLTARQARAATHAVGLTLLCSATPDPPSSIHLFPRLAGCRGLRLLSSTMSEHMQLSLALCRIGLYKVRKCKKCVAFFSLLKQHRCVLFFSCELDLTPSSFSVV